ncbi:MAG: hypothetical protein AAB554_05260 [Patescibacteria group bacterium]
MTDLDYRAAKTLRAAGLPTDLGALIGRTLAYHRYDRIGGTCKVKGITFGIGTLKLHLAVRDGVFKYRAIIHFDPRDPLYRWEAWFHGEEEPEGLRSVKLL